MANIKLSELMQNQTSQQGFPLAGIDGFSGHQQDGNIVQFTEVLYFKSKAEADRKYPNIPGYIKLHQGEYTSGHGWKIVLGCWLYETTKDNPFKMRSHTPE